jgi:hypothetical protein
MVDVYLVTINIVIPGGLVGVVAYEIQQTLTANARAKLLLAKKRKRQQQLLEDSKGVDLRDIMKQVDDEHRAEAEAKAAQVGLTSKVGGAVMKGTGMNMMGLLTASYVSKRSLPDSCRREACCEKASVR